MEFKTSKQIRQMWLDFFESKGHEVVASKSLIPVNDPSLLWINSGVATLKDYFSGIKIPKNPRITNSQKSIRTNDIENVGVTSRHHTFFEMLGNFSIGDYFKEEAISYGLEVLTDVFKFDLSKIFITYYEKDQVTYDVWIKLGIDPSHLIKGDREMNFWDIGQGPCGPDTEIFYDRGKKYDPSNIGIKLLQEDLENDRYVEIWNIVFSEFNNDGNGNYVELSQKNIDTGAGLERIASIFQDAPTNFDTDLFLPIIREIEKISGSKYISDNYFVGNIAQSEINKRFKIIADHMRAVAVAIQDGAKPSNMSRGYIIRRLIRRAYRSGMQLGIKDTAFLAKLLPSVARVLDMFDFDIPMLTKVITNEEISFSKTIKNGEALLQKSIIGKNELDFEVAFKPFETYGFPIELTKEILDEKGISLDVSKFNEFKEKHASASRGKKGHGMKSQISVFNDITEKVSEFIGYQSLKVSSRIKISKEENGKYYTLTNRTPFYATGGGQEFDKGTISGVHVEDVIKDKYGNNWHVTNSPVEGLRVELEVNEIIRTRKERNHTATHLLAEALSDILGFQVEQASSYNDEHKLTFGFKSSHRLSSSELRKVDEKVNGFIKGNYERHVDVLSYEDAISGDAIALAGEEYSDDVRVVDFGISKELCGGTHILNTNFIQKFKIIKMEKRGSGVFRIEAVTSSRKVDEYEQGIKESQLGELKRLVDKNKKLIKGYDLKFKDGIASIEDAIEIALSDYKNAARQSRNIQVDLSNILFENIDGVKTVIEDIENPALVKSRAISIRNKFDDTLVIITCKNSKLIAIASLKYNCKDVFNDKYPNARGGGSKEFIMGKL